MRKLVTENVLRRILQKTERKFGGTVRWEQGELVVQYHDAAKKEAFLDWLEEFRKFKTDRDLTIPFADE